ncbi:ABC TRANSPORTER [Encephalitozoon cuniculi GB-M1]|uniref:ABC TRANSPORTER n=1 Tax=Encephalitozoon cuniculi (strain GB-M1) TaxID=284813 RepID=Q8SRK7_ENCCU|nr:EPP-like transporter [Encephalitozoon cuniculi GB-M1]KMV65780.1 EPP-like transporter [Encephalitozoon cuniculi EcunIII-L]UYI27214.1 ABC transporter [Encephalitozoon cuniculi]CAD25588.1 ABC TRANSPORTER [Encephalitozoon cuniculi GB-M1]
MDTEDIRVEVVWRNVTVESVSEPFKGALIKRIQGKIEPSTMTALLGASGAGKTTMLNAIIGKTNERLKVSGEILLNGYPVDASVWKCAVGFVGEHLHAYETQTVEETLRFAVAISRDTGPETVVNEEVSCLIKALGLSRIAHTQISSISTGERTRLSLGITLAKRPSILIMDEVTNELDSFNVVHILKILMALRQQGKGIMISFQRLPQEMLSFFDKIMIICQGGVVFNGCPEECVEFFRSCGHDLKKYVGSSDFFMDVLSVDTTTPESEKMSLGRIARLKMCWKRIEPLAVSSIIEKTEFPTVSRRYILSFTLIFKRNLSDFLRRHELMRILSIQKLTTLALLVLVYFRLDYTQKGIRDRFGILSFIVMGSFEKTAAAAIIFLDSYRKALKREVCAGMYGAAMSYFASLVSSFCILGTSWIAYIAAAYWIVGLNPNILRFVFFVLILVIVTVFSMSFGIVVALHTKTLVQAQVLTSVLIMSFIILGGAFVDPGTIPGFARWAIWISPVYYALEIALQSQFEGLVFECKGSERCISNGNEALHLYGFRRVGYGVSVGMLLLITTVSIALGAISTNRVFKPRNSI